MESEGIPALPAYEGRDGLLRVWCTYCGKWHHHRPGWGHRTAHCRNTGSRYLETGYILVPGISEDDNGGQTEKRGMLGWGKKVWHALFSRTSMAGGVLTVGSLMSEWLSFSI
jgi:hypothetical protein